MKVSQKHFFCLIGMILTLVQCTKKSSVIASDSRAVQTERVSASVLEENDPKETYEKFCSGCHGHQMKAFVDRRWKHGNKLDDLVRSIRDGLVDEGMPAYGNAMTDQEILTLSEYILTGIKDRNSYEPLDKETPKFYTTDKYALVVDTIVSGLEIPWGIKTTADGTIYFTERKGTFKIRRPSGDVVEVKNVPKVRNKGQGGMMDVLLHPDFEKNNKLFLSYSKPMDKGQTTAVISARLEDDALTNIKEIFLAAPSVPTKYHFGCRMVFDNEGYLFITVGDRGKRDDHPQFLTNACGKVHRINEDGSIPVDNPYVDVKGAIASIWSYGHRNPQGLVYNPDTDELWAHEHGPRGGDELNLIRPQFNYGWPVISYGLNYDGTTFTSKVKAEGMQQPVQLWTPSIAPCGMALVRSGQFEKWAGDILTGSLRFNYISRISIKSGQVTGEERILKDIGRVRALEMGQDGFLYVGVEDSGRIFKVSVNKAEMLEMR